MRPRVELGGRFLEAKWVCDSLPLLVLAKLYNNAIIIPYPMPIFCRPANYFRRS